MFSVAAGRELGKERTGNGWDASPLWATGASLGDRLGSCTAERVSSPVRAATDSCVGEWVDAGCCGSDTAAGWLDALPRAWDCSSRGLSASDLLSGAEAYAASA